MSDKNETPRPNSEYIAKHNEIVERVRQNLKEFGDWFAKEYGPKMQKAACTFEEAAAALANKDNDDATP